MKCYFRLKIAFAYIWNMFILGRLISMSVNIVEPWQRMLSAILLVISCLGWLTYTAKRQYTGKKLDQNVWVQLISLVYCYPRKVCFWNNIGLLVRINSWSMVGNCRAFSFIDITYNLIGISVIICSSVSFFWKPYAPLFLSIGPFDHFQFAHGLWLRKTGKFLKNYTYTLN